jgi:hypothetical protein
MVYESREKIPSVKSKAAIPGAQFGRQAETPNAIRSLIRACFN